MIADIVPNTTTPSPNFVWQTLMVIAFFAGVGGNIATMFSIKRSLKREITPQPLEVREAPNPVTQQECMARHKESTDRFNFLETQIEKLAQVRHTDANALHEKINKVGLQVAGLERDTKTQNEWLVRIDGKLDQVNRKMS